MASPPCPCPIHLVPVFYTAAPTISPLFLFLSILLSFSSLHISPIYLSSDSCRKINSEARFKYSSLFRKCRRNLQRSRARGQGRENSGSRMYIREVNTVGNEFNPTRKFWKLCKITCLRYTPAKVKVARWNICAAPLSGCWLRLLLGKWIPCCFRPAVHSSLAWLGKGGNKMQKLAAESGRNTLKWHDKALEWIPKSVPTLPLFPQILFPPPLKCPFSVVFRC